MKKDNTLTERVAGLASKGLTATEIAVAIGVDVLVVRTLMYRDRRSHGSVCVGVRILDKFYPYTREEELLLAYRQRFGRLPRCNERIG